MKTKKLMMCLMASTFVLSGCKELTGSVEVIQNLTLKNSTGQPMKIERGSHPLKLKIVSKKKFDLIIQTTQGEQTATFKIDQNLKNLQSGQRLQVNADISGQPIELDGIYRVITASTEPERAYESCTYYTTEYRCRYVKLPTECNSATECNPSNPSQCHTRQVCTGGGTEHVCGNETVDHRGHHHVEYKYFSETESVEFNLINSANQIAAKVEAANSKTDKIYTHEDVCR